MQVPRRALPAKAGYAMLAVLLVLVSLLFLVAPFLATVRNADQTSRQRADDTAASLALDDAARLAAGRLGASHPGRDKTPYYDGLDELTVRNDLDPDFLWPSGSGAKWDLGVEDLAGRVDLDSAPPAMVANLLGLTTRLSEPLGAEDAAIKVTGTEGFSERGVLWVGGELILYQERKPRSFGKLERGLGSSSEDGEAAPGPLAPSSAPAGAPVMDQRAWALAQWRLQELGASDEPGGRVEPRGLGSLDRLAEVGEYVIEGDWDAQLLAPLLASGAIFGGRSGGVVWMPPARSLRPIEGGKTDTLVVDDPRWFNPGTTVRVHGDGVSELALVRAVNPRTGKLYLDRPLANDQSALGAVVEALARRAVNVNTASPAVLEALFANLQLVGRNARITRAEAKKLAELIVESRPLTGFQDFVERIVLPAAGLDTLPADAPVIPSAFRSDDAESLGGFIDPDDALALYRNALCSNDIELATSTMPLRFTSRDVYRFDLRVSVVAKSGVERLERVREERRAIAPRGPVMRLWTKQEDFDEELRLSRLAKLWNTGPNPTTRFDSFLGTDPPSRFQPHLASDAFKTGLKVSSSSAPAVERTFADRESEGWIQPLPSRVTDSGLASGHVLHFDWEPESNLGRDLGQRPLSMAASSPKVAWTDPTANALLRPLTFSAWIRPRTSGGYMLDVGASSREVDRVSLVVEGSDLVLRVRDGAGDHPATALTEVGEVRYPLDSGAGLPADTWSHVLVDVRGNRPDQMLLMVDARSATKTPGLTRLTGSISGTASEIPVESTDGFPDTCVLRIGEELIEAQVAGPSSFTATFNTQGPLAGFGGRLARERFVAPGGVPPLVNAGLSKLTDYPKDTPVELYGYSTPLAGVVSSASSTLAAALGPFAVARAVGVVGGQSPDGDAITWLTPLGVTLNLGTGLEGQTSATAIRLAPADLGRDPSEVMSAFSPSGGYAVIVQLAGGLRIGSDEVNQSGLGTPLFEIEVIHYSGWNGDELAIDRRGDACSELDRLVGSTIASRHAFVFNWDPSWATTDGDLLVNLLNWQAFVVPISVPVAGGGGGFGFPEPGASGSEFAQLTRLANAELTEWVRYDEVASSQLVRSDPVALTLLGNALAGGLAGEGDVSPPGPGGGGGPTTPGGGSGGGPSTPPGGALAMSMVPPAAAPAAPLVGAFWEPVIGVEEYDQWPLSHAVQSQLQFRGVMGTFTHAQPAGTQVLPVIRVADGDLEGGLPGRGDDAFLMDFDPQAPAWPVTVHRAYRPGTTFATSWQNAPDSEAQPLLAVDGQAETAVPDGGAPQGQVLVGLQAAAPVPIAPGVNTTVAGQTLYDMRETSRLVKFPSGERPRIVDTVALGESLFGDDAADLLLDEATFLSDSFGLSTGGGLPVLGSCMILSTELTSSGGSLRVQPFAIRRAGGVVGSATPILSELPSDAGLLRIGNELVCYQSYDEATGDITLAPNGRGMLGSKVEAHMPGEPVTYLDLFPISQLSAPISQDDAELNLEDTSGFGSSGLVRMLDELVHYTRTRGNTLTMPRASEVPGARDATGGGIFRGRYGTRPDAYPVGTPVVGYPFRFWDRWSDGADAPELSFFGFVPTETDAFWRRLFWTADNEREGAFVGCLVRTDPSVPWDADPDTTEGLMRFEGGKLESGGNPLDFQSSDIEVRLYTDHNPSAFDPAEGLSHGWKMGPRVRLFGLEYLAPGAVFERTWK